MENWQAEFFYGATPEIFNKARILRKNMTVPELELWNRLKGKKINGIRFRPQHPINIFIADFYCHKVKLVIEIDGEEHDKIINRNYDIERSNLMSSFGITTIRFKNDEVLNEIEKVLSIIEKYLS
jgi:very-short-patch-repair endonuclease